MPILPFFRRWRPNDRIACLVSYAILLLWCWPLLSTWSHYGALDWDVMMAYFDAVRRSVLVYKQLPGYYPWMYLGSSLWANPQIGPLSFTALLVMLFGVPAGMKLAIVLAYLLSFEAARSLGRTLFRHPLSAVCAGLLYALNAGFASHLVMGHFSYLAYPFVPWLVLWCLRLPSHRWAGCFAGALASVMLHVGIHYHVIYTFFLCFLLSLVVAWRERAWAALGRFCLLFGLTFGALSAFRLLPILSVMSDFPRQLYLPFQLDTGSFARMFFLPTLGPQTVWLRIPHPGKTFLVFSNEFYAYAGILVLLVSLLSLRRGLRFYHVGALLCLWLVLGNDQFWHLGFWLAKVPPFSSAWVFLRWRVVLLSCLAFCAAGGIEILIDFAQGLSPGWRPTLLRNLMWLLPLEIVLCLFPSWKQHVTPRPYKPLSRKELKLPSTKHMLSIKSHWLPGKSPDFVPIFAANVGIARGYDPLFGYLPARSLRLFHGHPRYKGEFTVDQKPVTPKLWSPNRILFQNLPPHKILTVNLNPGRGWTNNNTPLFEKLPTFSLMRPFVVKIPPSGTVDLKYSPPGLSEGLWLSLMCTLGLLLLWSRRNTQPPDA